jgi:hypothetical protein
MRARRKPNKPKPRLRQGRGLTKIKRTEITRAALGVLAAGLTLSGVEIDPISGKFRVLVGEPAPTAVNDVDDWLRKKDAH